MASRLLTFAVWAVVLATALFWGLRVFVQKPGLPAQVQMPSRGLAMGGELKRLLGASVVAVVDEEEEPEEGSDRFHLLGVVAPRGASLSAQGVALIAVGGEPAKAWRTGAVVDGDTVLLSVDKRSVKLGPRGGPATTELKLPEPEAAATGPVGGAPGAVRPMQGLQQPGTAPMRPGGVMQPGLQNGIAGHNGAQQVPRPTRPMPQGEDTSSDDEEEEE
ncbi:MAG TPA: hypothetical protein VLA16_09240 [Ideonella sp.]|nr:hypothetical protein [Ideonella sp.]